jgi:hypothetical protein
MYKQHVTSKLSTFENIQIIDGEFDRFESSNELEKLLREEVKFANFHHNTLNEEK